MKVGWGRYVVVVRASASPWCGLCGGDGVVAEIDPDHPYGPTQVPRPCPHCSITDNLPLVYLPRYRDIPRSDHHEHHH